VKQCECHSCKS